MFALFRVLAALTVPQWRIILLCGVGLFLLFIGLLLLVGQVPIRYNVRNLMVRWLTTAMTGLAFTLVVALSIYMLAFVNGMYRLTQQSGQPGNVIILSDGATDEQFSNLEYTDYTNLGSKEGVQKIQRKGEAEALLSKEVYVVVTQPVKENADGTFKRRFIQVRGIEDGEISGAVHGLKLQEGGSWFDPIAGVEANPSGGDNLVQAVIGGGLAGELGGDRPGGQPLKVGDTFPLGEAKGKLGTARLFVVKGILDSSGSTFDSEVWAKRQLVGDMFGKARPTSIVVRSKDLPTARKLAVSYKEMKDAALNAQPEVEYFSKLSETSRQFFVFMMFAAGLMSVGGVFGVMNTMFAAITQRRKDIGVLRIIGFSRRHVVISFLLESMLLALVAGLLGCAIGLCFDGQTAKSVVSAGAGGGAKFVVLKMSVTSEILALGLLLSLFMGFIGGLIPAVGAMRLRALDSMR